MSQATLLVRLKADAQIQSSESTFTDDKLNELLTLALAQHNSITENSWTYDTLPTGDDELVLILAHIRVCYIRASGFVNNNDLSGPDGYGQDRSTPYKKNMDMAKVLRTMYNDRLGSGATDNQQIVVGRLLVPDSSMGYEVPLTISPAIPVQSSYSELTSTTVVLSWSIPVTDKFQAFYVYSSDTSGIHQEWNLTAVSTDYPVPHISADATKETKITDYNQRAVKVTGLTPGSTVYFLVASESTSYKYGYSNELEITVPSS